MSKRSRKALLCLGALLDFLTAEPAQRALSARGLLPALPGLRLYGPDCPMLQALEIALDGGCQARPSSGPGSAAPRSSLPRRCTGGGRMGVMRGWTGVELIVISR